MKLFTMKTNKAELIISANELLEQRQVLIYLLLLTFTFSVLF